ncbi:hypothetical protein A3D71_04420 [Candidatus Kaiserbacteria bacterium RIFCSPHIGHO2_02_FULL_55_20]|uniref:Uncharacterized protein n=1 Tax=Candidatus Kaiserbacteria bacterium RIFCSPHIGHO2_02_FULL_55_20 TaxID=1798497 RepID=A0A1F6DYM7_9BACT|nr:MAG: hypothetical protein A3D71_04420 [Candidatus Kaiserbacteria bacterium RIFCSPHIGHO2_02_FULL_55_20]
MTYDYHIVFGVLSVLLGLFGYGLYFRSIFGGTTKPHVFTWLVYFLIDIIVFTAQVLNGAGPGAWVTFTGVVGTFCVAVVALKRGEKHITWSDWASFVAALCAIVLWRLTSDALIAVVISALINFLAMLPTFRKSYGKPQEESVSIWLVDFVRFFLSIIALSTLSFTTALFPSAVVIGNASLIAMILVRRRQLAKR